MRRVSVLLCLTLVLSMFSVMPISAVEPADVTSGAATELVKYDWENESAEVGTNISETYIYRSANDQINTEYDKLVLVENPLKAGINTSEKAAMIEISDDETLATANLKLQFGFTDSLAAGETLITKFKVYRPSTAPEDGDELYMTQFGSVVNAAKGTSSNSANRLGALVLKQVAGGNQLRLGTASDNLAKIFDENWHEVVSVFDMTARTVTVLLDGEVKGTTALPDSTKWDGTEKAEKYFEFTVNAQHQPDSSNRTWPDPNEGAQHIYLDDISAYRVKAATITSPVNGTANVDPAEAITLNFTVPVTDAEALKNAISVNNGTEVSLVTLAEDGMSAEVLLNNVQYGGAAYTLTVNKDTFKDCYLRGLAADATVSFTAQINAPMPKATTELEVYDWEDYEVAEEITASNADTKYEKDKITVQVNPLPGDSVNSSDKVLRFELTDELAAGTKSLKLNLGFMDSNNENETLITKFKVYRGSENPRGLHFPQLGSVVNASATVGGTSSNRITSNTLTRNTDGQKIDYATSISDEAWHEVVTVIDMKAKTMEVIVDGNSIKTGEVGDITENETKCIEFAAYAVRRESDGYPAVGMGTQYLYIDDIAAYRVKTTTVMAELTEGQTEVDPMEPIALNFNLPVTDAAALKNAISIVNTSTNDAIAPERISAVLAADGLSASIIVAGGLEYLRTPYTLTVDKDTFPDAYKRKLAADYTLNFVTKTASGINIVDSVTPVWDGSKLTATVTVKNPTETEGAAWVILASFTDDNYMTAIDFVELESVGAKGESAALELVLDDVGEATEYRVFLWDEPESLTPYHMPIELTK